VEADLPLTRTIAEPVDLHAPPIKKSRFIGHAAPVCSSEQALAHVSAVRAAFADARHHCWAYQLADGEYRSSDDGEPGGSAGRPILAQLRGHELVDVCVVVTRYFGGVKLGVGGLIRAYGGVAGQTLDIADVLEVASVTELTLHHSYEDTGAVQNVFASNGIEVAETRWNASVFRRIRVVDEHVQKLIDALGDATSGRVAPD